MAFGKLLFQISSQDLVKGMSSSDTLSDGGFSPLTDQVQLTASPGAAYQASFPTDASTGLLGEMIASCESPSLSYARLYVSTDINQAGQFYSFNGSLTARGALDTSHSYITGRTDMISFDGEVYGTNATTLVRWSSVGSSDTFDFAFYAFTNGGAPHFAPHPAIVYNGFAYYGDGNLLLRQSTAGAAPSVILTLASNQNIVALAIDPGSGQLLLSVVGIANVSDTAATSAYVSFYDGTSAQVSRTVQVDDMVTAFPVTEGALFAAYGQSLGQWNGSGISFLRRFDIDFDNNQLMYKHHFTSVGATLYLIQRNNIIAYGEVRQKGDKIFYPALQNRPSGFAVNLTNIAYLGQNQISISYATAKFAVWNTAIITGTPNPMSFYTNSYDFDDEVWVRRIRVIWADPVGINVQPGSLELLNENGVIFTGGNGSGAYSLINDSGALSAFKDILNIDIKVKMLQVLLNIGNQNPGIRRILVYGDPANITGSSN